MATKYRRDEVLVIVTEVEEVFKAWQQVRTTANARIYLLSLLLWSRWERV